MNSKDILYLAALVAGDGYLERGRHRIDIRVASRHFNEGLAKRFSSISPKVDLRNLRLRITSTEVYRVLSQEFGIPSGRKSKIISIPEVVFAIPLEEVVEYVAGWYDAEGWFELDKRYKPAYPRMRFAVTSQAVQKGLSKLLRRLAVPVATFTGGTRFFIDINGRGACKRFISMIPLHHEKWLEFKGSVMNMSPLLAHTARQVNQAGF